MHLPLSALIAIWFAASVNAGGTIYVATDGSDVTGDGSSGDPWATITQAVDNALDGATIIVRPGTYNGRVRLRREFGSRVVVRSETPYAALLRHDDGAALIAFTARNITAAAGRCPQRD